MIVVLKLYIEYISEGMFVELNVLCMQPFRGKMVFTAKIL
jgi:hypothetical protein